MIRGSDLPALPQIRALERRLGVATNPAWANLVVPSDHDVLPVHRWFRFKESFAASLFPTILREIGPELGPRFSFLDPFCGVGTSLIAAQTLSALGIRIETTGIEYNPLISFIARTKAQWPLVDIKRVRELAGNVLLAPIADRDAVPSLSSFKEERCMSAHTARRLLGMKQAILKSGSGVNQDCLLLALASAVERLSRTRKDGRALRLVPKKRARASTVVAARFEQVLHDLQFMQAVLKTAPVPTILNGDGRQLASYNIPPRSVDLVLTSPPYPNNIDYSEVYKLELWLLGFVQSTKEFYDLRHNTFRSHPTADIRKDWKELRARLARGRTGTLLSSLFDSTDPESWRQRLVIGYCSDLWDSLSQSHRVLRSGGYAVIVVGNSLHGGKAAPYLVPTDMLVATIGERVGFAIRGLTLARGLKRRLTGNHFLRESVVILQKK